MEKKRAVELLTEEVDKIPRLKTLPSSNDEFRLWLKTVENIINSGLEADDKNRFQATGQFLRYIRYEEDLMQQDYVDEIVRYEIALKSIIQKYEILDTGLDNINQRLLNDIFSASLISPNGVNALRFRVDNQQFIPEIDQIERLGYVERKNDLYFIRPLVLAQLSKVNPDARSMVQICNLVFTLLRGNYQKNLRQKVTISDIVRNTSLSEDDVRIALRILIQTPVWGSHSNDFTSKDAYIEPSESILKYNSFEDLLKQMQEWAEKQNTSSPESAKPDTTSPKYPVKPSLPLSESQAIWKDIKTEYDVTKRSFGKRINFVKDPFKRTVIYRDVEQAFILERSGFSKPAVILAGGVIEELLRLYLKQKGISPQKPLKKDFNGYIQTCEQKGLLKAGISRLSDSARHFRNLVHLSNEETKKHAISKSTAKGAVASIFTIANDF